MTDAELTAATGARLTDPATAARLRAAMQTATRLHDQGGHREATARAYAADLRCFTGWCASVGVEAVPASPAVVAAYVGHLVNAGRAVSTVRRRLAGIAHAHREAGHATPTTHDDVRRVLRGLDDDKAATRTGRGQAASLTPDDVRAMVGTCDDTTRGRLERAVILTGYAAALRRSELAGLDVADVEITSRGALVTLRGSKTSRAGQLERIAIRRTGDDVCPVAALVAWMDAAGVESGSLFRGVDNAGRVGGRIAGRTVARIVTRAAERAGLDATRVRGHSLRRAHVTVRDQAGEDRAAIRATTRHRSDRMIDLYSDVDDAWRAAEGAARSLWG